MPVADVLAPVLPAPLLDDIRDVRDLHAEDERQARGLDRLLVRLGDHARVRDHGDIRQVVGGHELLDHRQHRLGLGPVALEGRDHEREPVLAGEQADRDLGLQAALLGEPGLAEPVALAGLEVERGHVVEDQAGRPEPGVRGAGFRQPLPPLLLRIGRQAPLDRRVRRRRDPGLLKDPQAVELARRLNDPGQYKVPEHLVPARGVLQAQNPVAMIEGIQQVAHPGGGDRQRPAARRLQAQVEFQLSGRDPLLCRGLQRLQPRLIVRRPEMFDLPRPAPRGPHDLHRGRPRCGLYCPHVRHRATLRAAPSAQVHLSQTANQQVNATRSQRTRDREPTQVTLSVLVPVLREIGPGRSGVARRRCALEKTVKKPVTALMSTSKPAYRGLENCLVPADASSKHTNLAGCLR